MAGKNMEKTFNELITRYILATMKDIRSEYEGTDPFPAVFDKPIEVAPVEPKPTDGTKKKEPKKFIGWQHYDNFILNKDVRVLLQPVLTIQAEVKAMLVTIFDTMIKEIKNIDMVDNDNLETVRQKLIDANAICLNQFIIDFGNTIKPSFGATLESAGDENQYFGNKIVGNVPQYKNKPILTGILAMYFDTFLKAISWVVAKQQWYESTPLNKKYFLGLLAGRGLSYDFLDIIENGIKQKAVKATKAPSAPRKKKTTSTTNNTNSVSSVINDIVEKKPDAVPVEEDEDAIFATE
jgi:hypothetical protein